MFNLCFVCGQNIKVLDKIQGGFKTHVNQVHNVWNYIFYISYLMDKKETELTGFESYVKEKIDEKDISWFPILDI